MLAMPRRAPRRIMLHSTITWPVYCFHSTNNDVDACWQYIGLFFPLLRVCSPCVWNFNEYVSTRYTSTITIIGAGRWYQCRCPLYSKPRSVLMCTCTRVHLSAVRSLLICNKCTAFCINSVAWQRSEFKKVGPWNERRLPRNAGDLFWARVRFRGEKCFKVARLVVPLKFILSKNRRLGMVDSWRWAL